MISSQPAAGSLFIHLSVAAIGCALEHRRFLANSVDERTFYGNGNGSVRFESFLVADDPCDKQHEATWALPAAIDYWGKVT